MDITKLKLEREILKLKPNYSVKKIEQLADDILDYWINACLPDVLETI